jgi:hypothetical protein
MKRIALALLATVALATAAQAHPHHRHYTQIGYEQPRFGEGFFGGQQGGGRPANCRGIAWCGCFLRDLFGIADTSLNLALNWARKFPHTSPHVGAVVVWNHGGGHGHVGVIVGGGPGRWEIKSGNDGHAVRTRVRDISNAYAVVQPNGRA